MTRLAIIGCTDSAQAYANTLAQFGSTSFAAVVDPDLNKARITAQSIGAVYSCSTLDDLLELAPDSFDGVLIDWENCAHSDLTSKAASAGKHVLVEPPLGLSAREADTAIASCQSAGVRLMIGHRTRYLEPLQKIKQNLESGKLGDPGLVRIHHWEPLPESSKIHLKQDSAGSGGTILARVVQDIDVAIWLYGELPTEIYAVGRKQSTPEALDPDYVQLHFGFSRGGMSLIDYSMTLPQGPEYFSLSVIGSSGAAYADDHDNIQLLYGGGNATALNSDKGDRHVVTQFREFLDSIQQNREPSVTGKDGRASVQVAEAAVKSIASNKTAQLKGGHYELI